MIAEHIFVTTLKPAEAFDLSSQFLGHFGFAAEAPASVLDPKQQSICFSRGAKRPRRNDSMNKWKQRVMLQYDRGRVTVAASIVSPVSGRWTTETSDIPKAYNDLAEKYLFEIATTLDRLLAYNGSPDSALAGLTEFEDNMVKVHAQQIKRKRIISITVVCIFILLMFFLVMFLIGQNVR